MNQSETCTVSGRNCIATSPPSQGRTSHLRNSSGIPRLHLNHGVVVLCGVAFRPAMVQPGSPVEARLPLHACPSETTMWERLGKGTADAHPRCSLPHSRQAGATGEGCGISRAKSERWWCADRWNDPVAICYKNKHHSSSPYPTHTLLRAQE